MVHSEQKGAGSLALRTTLGIKAKPSLDVLASRWGQSGGTRRLQWNGEHLTEGAQGWRRVPEAVRS